MPTSASRAVSKHRPVDIGVALFELPRLELPRLELPRLELAGANDLGETPGVMPIVHRENDPLDRFLARLTVRINLNTALA